VLLTVAAVYTASGLALALVRALRHRLAAQPTAQ
jgi:hypothetical protein